MKCWLFYTILLALSVTAVLAAVTDVHGNTHGPDNDNIDSDDFYNDRCTACDAVVDSLDRAMKKIPKGKVRGVGKSDVEMATSELRALEIIDEGLCNYAIGSTRGKCERFVEEHESEIIAYIRKAEHKTDAKRNEFCKPICEKYWERRVDEKKKLKEDKEKQEREKLERDRADREKDEARMRELRKKRKNHNIDSVF